MRNLSKILSVVDPTAERQTAMQRAAWLARRADAQLELMTCNYNESVNGPRRSDYRSLESACSELVAKEKRQLKELAEPLRNDGMIVATTVLWDRPLYEGIVRHVVNSGADIVFKDTHAHSIKGRATFSNTDWNLIRLCPAPLWLVKAREVAAAPTIIASIDPMNEHDKPAALDDKILGISNMLREIIGGSVHAFHSYDPRIATAAAKSGARVPTSLPLNEIEVKMRADHKRRFRELLVKHGIDDDHAHLATGETDEELSRFAGRIHADLIVMGAIARNRWKRLFIGSTAERTLGRLHCDLLFVKPDWFRTPIDSTYITDFAAYE